MGMDVYGKAHTAPEGEYFRRNVWGWRLLAQCVYEVAPDESAPCKLWHTNDGDGLTAAQSVKLADALDARIADGSVERWCNANVSPKYDDNIPRTWYSTDVASVQEFSTFVRHSGGFEIC